MKSLAMLVVLAAMVTGVAVFADSSLATRRNADATVAPAMNPAEPEKNTPVLDKAEWLETRGAAEQQQQQHDPLR